MIRRLQDWFVADQWVAALESEGMWGQDKQRKRHRRGVAKGLNMLSPYGAIRPSCEALGAGRDEQIGVVEELGRRERSSARWASRASGSKSRVQALREASSLGAGGDQGGVVELAVAGAEDAAAEALAGQGEHRQALAKGFEGEFAGAKGKGLENQVAGLKQSAEIGGSESGHPDSAIGSRAEMRRRCSKLCCQT